jgi:effector-binding domain-containing protein
MVELSSTAAGFTPDDIGPVVRPLCAELGRRLPEATGVKPTGRLTCYYEAAGDEVVIHAALPASVEIDGELNGLTVVDHPATPAATVVHRGPIDDVLPAWQALARWIEDNGRRTNGPGRELYLDCPEDLSRWVTELQEPITP